MDQHLLRVHSHWDGEKYPKSRHSFPSVAFYFSVKLGRSPAKVTASCLDESAHVPPRRLFWENEPTRWPSTHDHPYPRPLSGATRHTWTSSPRYSGEFSISPHFGRTQPQYHALLSCTSSPTPSSTPHHSRSSAKSLRHTCPSSFWILFVRLADAIPPLCSYRFVFGQCCPYIRVVLCPQ